jgi:charged multivesicular body protein 1
VGAALRHILQALAQGNTEGARIYASNAIRKKNEGLNLLRLGSRIDAVASRVETAVTMRQVSRCAVAQQQRPAAHRASCMCRRSHATGHPGDGQHGFGGQGHGPGDGEHEPREGESGRAGASGRCIALTRCGKISLVMEKFEQQFEDMDVQTSYMEGTMGATTASATPQDQVDSLMSQVADENGIELDHALGDASVARVPDLASKAKVQEPEEDDRLAERLRALRPAT